MKIVTIVRGLFVLALVKAFFIIFMLSNQIMEKDSIVSSTTQIQQQIFSVEVPSVQAKTLPEKNIEEEKAVVLSEKKAESALQKKLLEKERDLDRKEKELQTLEASINKKLQELQTLQKKLDSALQDVEGVKNKNLLHLIDVYSNMKSQQAAVVLENLDEKIAIQILSGMKGRKAGEILSFVETNKAAKLSEQLTKLQIPFK